MNNNCITVNATIVITEENKVKIRCIIKELEALGAISQGQTELILSGSELL